MMTCSTLAVKASEERPCQQVLILQEKFLEIAEEAKSEENVGVQVASELCYSFECKKCPSISLHYATVVILLSSSLIFRSVF
jgi:hypothetical protein